MENFALVREFLGGKKVIGSPETELDFVELIREGFAYPVFASLQRSAKLSDETLFQSLGIARRTAARRKGAKARLKPNESEGALRLARVLATATEALGTRDKARLWLQTPNRALGGRAPLTLLDTGIGFQRVMDVLSRIEHGTYS